jgi:hypothetical protein
VFLTATPAVLFGGKVGTLPQPRSVVLGNEVDQTTFASVNGVSVSITITRSAQPFFIDITTRSQLLLAAQVGSLVGSIIAVAAIALRAIEHWILPRWYQCGCDTPPSDRDNHNDSCACTCHRSCSCCGACTHRRQQRHHGQQSQHQHQHDQQKQTPTMVADLPLTTSSSASILAAANDRVDIEMS